MLRTATNTQTKTVNIQFFLSEEAYTYLAELAYTYGYAFNRVGADYGRVRGIGPLLTAIAADLKVPHLYRDSRPPSIQETDPLSDESNHPLLWQDGGPKVRHTFVLTTDAIQTLASIGDAYGIARFQAQLPALDGAYARRPHPTPGNTTQRANATVEAIGLRWLTPSYIPQAPAPLQRRKRARRPTRASVTSLTY